MEQRTTISNMQFEWDPEKEKSNIAKHGIDFTTAISVFGDAYRIEKYDINHSTDEERFITIGRVDLRTIIIVAVIYTERNTAIRIISARIATKKEEEEYFNDNQENY